MVVGNWELLVVNCQLSYQVRTTWELYYASDRAQRLTSRSATSDTGAAWSNILPVLMSTILLIYYSLRQLQGLLTGFFTEFVGDNKVFS
ncbi:hypothetical protein [Microcoleus sp. herbarium12]|uniref:hypothetical protein n=1 Tax=Microcoleus sp. herbarium12 TaxID=3055437 RepID=UPI002FD60045